MATKTSRDASEMTLAEYHAECERLHGGPIGRNSHSGDVVYAHWNRGATPNEAIVEVHYRAACRQADRDV
jgi:hypothetical protein